MIALSAPFPELAPPDARDTTADDPRRCWNCDCYSFKTYASERDNDGKCFRDFKTTGKYYYVNGNMVCDQFAPNRNDQKSP